MVTTHIRGHKTYWNEDLENPKWFYVDTDEEEKDQRPCVRCGCYPTEEGYDACLGYVEGAKHVCCGHGVWKANIYLESDD